MNKTTVLYTGQLIFKIPKGSSTHSLTHSLTHSVTFLWCSLYVPTRMKIDAKNTVNDQLLSVTNILIIIWYYEMWLKYIQVYTSEWQPVIITYISLLRVIHWMKYGTWHNTRHCGFLSVNGEHVFARAMQACRDVRVLMFVFCVFLYN